MFIEFETGSGRTLLNVRHIVQVKRFQDLSDAITGEKVSNFPVCRKAKSSPRLRIARWSKRRWHLEVWRPPSVAAPIRRGRAERPPF